MATSLQRFSTPAVHPGDITGRAFQAASAAEKDNASYRSAAIDAIHDNQSLRYVVIPGSSALWPVPKILWESLPGSLKA